MKMNLHARIDSYKYVSYGSVCVGFTYRTHDPWFEPRACFRFIPADWSCVHKQPLRLNFNSEWALSGHAKVITRKKNAKEIGRRKYKVQNKVENRMQMVPGSDAGLCSEQTVIQKKKLQLQRIRRTNCWLDWW